MCIRDRDFVESYYKVQSDKLTSHLRIVQLSDLHLRECGENNCDLVARSRGLKPDMIAITGDMNDKKSDIQKKFYLFSIKQP